MAIIRSISGLRATTDELTKELVQSYAAAFATYVPTGPIVIGRDGRPSGSWMEEVIIETLLKHGHDVISLGIAPTPTVQLETEHSLAVGGISITASHNPSEWNGMKFLHAGGVFLNGVENREFWSILDGASHQNDSGTVGILTCLENVEQRHISHVFQSLHQLGIDSSEHVLTAVVDAVNASGSTYVPALLQAMNCNGISLFCDQTGVFPHTPEPISENLGDLMNAVKHNKADVGIAVDPDADRLVLIDELGNPIGEEKTIALCVKAIIEIASPKIVHGDLAVNLSTSLMSEIIARNAGWNVHRTPVGEINVVEAMKTNACIIGGEGSGGVILPSCHYGRDSLVGIALILSLMKHTQKPLSVLSAELPSTTMIKGKMQWTGSAQEVFQSIEQYYQSSCHEIRHDDGLWLRFSEGWIHVRTSNTEPILRFIVEHTSKSEAEQQVGILTELLKSKLAQ
ncbi:MAG: phosphoglucosamine mutase [Bacteroidota bacterium]